MQVCVVISVPCDAVPWHCWMRANLSPVAAKYNSSYTQHKTVIRPLVLFVLMWNFLFRYKIICKNNHTFFNFSTGYVCELTSRSHHSGWVTWASPGAGHPTERAGPEIVVPSFPRTVGKQLSCSHQPRDDSSVMIFFLRMLSAQDGTLSFNAKRSLPTTAQQAVHFGTSNCEQYKNCGWSGEGGQTQVNVIFSGTGLCCLDRKICSQTFVGRRCGKCSQNDFFAHSALIEFLWKSLL